MRSRHAWMLAGLVVASLAPTPGGAQTAVPDRAVTWLSAGDSYSAGEGIGDDVVDERCARSTRAYGPVAAELLRDQRGWEISPDPFVACTGDVVSDFFHARSDRPSQLDWADDQGLAAGSKADVMLFSFGGNDIGFPNVIFGCIPPALAVLAGKWEEVIKEVPIRDGCDPVDDQPMTTGLMKRIDDLVETGIRSSRIDPDGRMAQDGTLGEFYRRVLNENVTDNGVLVVLGYPRLFAPSEDWGSWRGGRCATFGQDDADRLGTVAEYFDERLQEAVAAVDPSGRRVRFVSRLRLFDGDSDRSSHSLCGGNTEWLNRLTAGLNDPAVRFDRSFHPNEPGHAATAELVAGSVEDWARVNARSTISAPVVVAVSTTAVPITTGRRFDIGDKFDASCVVAWPTAPVRSRSGTDMRMSCGGVPNQFLFVDVHTDDRDLAITPSTGTVRVIGEIVDVAESEHGYRTLVVSAREVILPR